MLPIPSSPRAPDANAVEATAAVPAENKSAIPVATIGKLTRIIYKWLLNKYYTGSILPPGQLFLHWYNGNLLWRHESIFGSKIESSSSSSEGQTPLRR